MPAVGPFTEPPKPTKIERATQTAREAIGGDKRAAVRRILLWLLVITFVSMGAPVWLCLMPIALLMATDGLL